MDIFVFGVSILIGFRDLLMTELLPVRSSCMVCIIKSPTAGIYCEDIVSVEFVFV